MTWYAIRTTPGAQLPQREFAVERTRKTRSSKGYRIVPSLNADVSAIERALSNAGIDHYMPVERRLMRDRLRPYLWKSRRFALIVGYMFVRDPDWYVLADVPGVLGVVGIDGVAQPVDFFDMLQMFEAEQKAAIEFQEQSRKARQLVRKAAKRDPSLQKIVDKLDVAGTITVPLGTIQKAA